MLGKHADVAVNIVYYPGIDYMISLMRSKF